VKGQQWLEGLEELHPDLVHRLLNPDLKRDMEELKQIGMGSEAVVSLLARNETQVSASLTDLRELLADQRKMKETSGVNQSLARLEKQKAVKDAKCSLHAGQTVLYLVEACLAINDAAQACPRADQPHAVSKSGWRRGEDAKGVCAIDVMAIFAGFGWTSFFLSSIASQCAHTLVPGKAVCAADVTAVVAALMDLGEASAGLATDCKYTGLKETFMKARAKVSSKSQPNSELAWCVIHPMQASYWLMRAALFIKAATKDCGHDADDCAIDALYVISSFGWAAAFLASTVSFCSPLPDANALCAGDVANLVAALTMVSAQGIAFDGAHCRDLPTVGGRR